MANGILKFAGTSINILTDAQYAVDADRTGGNVEESIARSALVNKALLQASAMAAGLAQMTSDNQPADVEDADTVPETAAKIADAVRSVAGVVPTPPQFDDDTSSATTAFVQRASGNYRDVRSAGASITLDASDLGCLIEANSPTNIFITLPDATVSESYARGNTFTIMHTEDTGRVTVQSFGGNRIIFHDTFASSVALDPADTIELTATGGINWYVSGGSVLTKKSFTTLPKRTTDRSVATTEFVQQNRGGYVGVGTFASSQTLPLSIIGGIVLFTGSGTYTLPFITLAHIGVTTAFENNTAADVIINVTGIYRLRVGSNDVTEITLRPGDTVQITNRSTTWSVTSGTALLQYAPDLGSLARSTNGTVQRLPSGLVMVFGQVTVPPSGNIFSSPQRLSVLHSITAQHNASSNTAADIVQCNYTLATNEISIQASTTGSTITCSYLLIGE